MSFSPIAIVGRSCVLPGALNPEALWELVSQGENAVSPVDDDRWRAAKDDVLCRPDEDPSNRTWSDRGGYVRGFERIWNPEGFGIPADKLEAMDPLVHWSFHCAREALIQSGDSGKVAERPRVGAVFGNLGFPSSSMTAFAEENWLGREAKVDPKNRFMSGGSAQLLRQALGLSAKSLCLDTACASSLYAIKLACDWLHEHEVDLALAGAVNRSDDLFLHVGFTALKALSKSGQSRPFHADADGLVPAEGAGFLALKRLENARRDGNHIYGVIRGIGLSNDGRGRGFLAPLESGQKRALDAAYAAAEIDPSAVSLLECHATGTAVGDATEIRSSADTFAGAEDLPIGSLKSNMGHLITAAGVAGVIKVLEAMRHQKRPPSLHMDRPNPALKGGPLRVLQSLEDWPSAGPRLAGVSAFGFGGNNAHVILSEEDPSVPGTRLERQSARARSPLAIVGLGTVVGDQPDRGALTDLLLREGNQVQGGGTESQILQLRLKGLRFPPADLQQSLPQQLFLLKAAREAVETGVELPRDRTGIFIGMEPDLEVCRFGLRWRLPTYLRQAGAQIENGGKGLDAVLDTIVPTLQAAGVVGNMPNIPANRLNSQFDLGGASWSLSSGKDSGLMALEAAHRALSNGELDAAIVGAVDLCCTALNESAAKAAGLLEGKPADAAVVLVLKRLEEAEAKNETVLAVLEEQENASLPIAPDFIDRLGDAGAATALRDLACTAILTAHRIDSSTQRAQLGSQGELGFRVGAQGKLSLRPHRTALSTPAAGRIHLFAAADPQSLRNALEEGREGGSGPCRAALVAASPQDLQRRKEAALRQLNTGRGRSAGVHVRLRPVTGELAFVFAGAGAGYRGMGNALLTAFPELKDSFAKESPAAAAALAQPWPSNSEPDALQRLWASSALSQFHSRFTQSILGLRPQAVLGYSSGESNSLFATGAWQDLDAMIDDARESELFTRALGGPMTAVEDFWGHAVSWETWSVRAPLERIQDAISSEERVFLTVIHSDQDAIIAGDAQACTRVRKVLGTARCIRLHYDLAVHLPILDSVRDAWLDLHRRTVKVPEGVRIYSGGHEGSYLPSTESCAQAILAQSNRTLDFRKQVEAAYQDGVRTFVEQGPGGSCSRWIQEILGPREAVVVSLDKRGQGLEATLNAVAALWAAGIETACSRVVEGFNSPAPTEGPILDFVAHPRAIDLRDAMPQPPSPKQPSLPEAAMQPMPTAPILLPTAAAREDSPPAAPIAVAPSRLVKAPPPNLEGIRPPGTSLQPKAQAKPLAPSVEAEVPGDPKLIALRAQISALGAAAQAHISQQTELHHRFLQLQGEMMQLLGTSQSPSAVSPRPHAPDSPLPTLPVPVQTGAGRYTPAPQPAKVLPPTTTPQSRPPSSPPVKAKGPSQDANPTLQPSPLANAGSPRTLPGQLKIDSKASAAGSTTTPPPPKGPQFNRSQLEIHASGRISEIFGEAFEVQDNFHRQVRMPEPPLLLADRITGLDAVAGSMGKGTIWSETDVQEDGWYLHQGHMPSGVMIESGQADLMLISYLGVDFTNQNDRVYRLLGCELTYHDGLPRAGETLCYDIHMDGHATQGEVRLMFFHYNCRVDGQLRLAVRKGQAGFFTDAELAESDGCLWSPEEAASELSKTYRLDPPAISCTKSEFSMEELRAFSDGQPWQCFGPGFEKTQCHTRTPRIQNGPMMLLGPISGFDPKGGPWGRGTMKSSFSVPSDHWFFDGHFKNDPCMPGTLMFEGCLQLMATYLTAMGYTVNRDGWRFEPVSDMPFQLQCRGQVTPKSKLLTYELFVEEVHDGPVPTLIADLLCTVDGLKAFHAKRIGLQLKPAWPLDEGNLLLKAYEEPKEVAKAGNFPFDFRSLLACANGKPSEAFGPIYNRFDGPGRVARLPNPPYHFLSRVTRTEGEIGTMTNGMEVDVEYDIPHDAWYFDENGCRVMPFAVLLEAALQPCGWLASYLGCALTTETELCFRNLDGTGTVHCDVFPDAGTLLTRVKSTGISKTSDMIIVSFNVECTIENQKIYSLETVFGFFPQSALENQVGLPTTDEQRSMLEIDGDKPIVLRPTARPPSWDRARPQLAEPMLLMLDRIAYFDPAGGKAGLGAARGEKDVEASEWFFKAHFFQDPVQPGSLGIEAMIQLLQWTVLELELDKGIENPRFEAIACGEQMCWKYRGQVIPDNRLISTTLEITEIRREAESVLVIADASLWVDGKRIYEASGLGMRVASGGAPDRSPTVLDPEANPWLKDHCPTWTAPSLPMMSVVEMLAQGACQEESVIGIRDLRLQSWIPMNATKNFCTERQGEHVRLMELGEDGDLRELASARVLTGAYPIRKKPIPSLAGPESPSPYESGALFHGPSFQVLERLIQTEAGASSWLCAESGLPIGRLNPALLDGATHGIPHDQLNRWFAEIDDNQVAYPARIPSIDFFGPTPTSGTLRCEVRPDGNLGHPNFPAFRIEISGPEGLWCTMRLVEACFPKGTIGQADPEKRRAFLRDKRYVPDLRTSKDLNGTTELVIEDLKAIDWLPGTIAGLYGTKEPTEIALREHIAHAHKLHPSILPEALPLRSFHLDTENSEGRIRVSGDPYGQKDLSPVVDFWTQWFDRDPWPVEDLYYGLIDRFVGRVVIEDPDAFAAVKGQSLLYLGNHQVGVESLLFSILASGLSGVPTVTLAKAEHRHTWLGKLISHCFSYPGVEDPRVITFFDREDKESLPQIIAELAQEMAGPGRSVMVHVEGTRSLDCRTPVQKMSGAFLDMALAVNAPVVPIRFAGALPVKPLQTRLEFPIGMGRQDLYIGRPILPEDLAPMHYGERKSRVIAAINGLGPDQALEEPTAGDPAFASQVEDWRNKHGSDEEHAVLGCVLAERESSTHETRALVEDQLKALSKDLPSLAWLQELNRRLRP